ncbi:unnamed protein product, partial [Iphiclides podalirius]
MLFCLRKRRQEIICFYKDVQKAYLTMSRYKQPKTLEGLALNRLGDWIAQIAELQMIPAAILGHENISKAQVDLIK